LKGLHEYGATMSLSTAQRGYLAVRGVIERLLAVLALVLLFVPLALIAFAVWLQDFGNPLFLHERVGRYQRIFRVVKLRTMVIGADHLLVDGRIPAGVSRVTSLGRLLRRSSIDEIPQLLNVIRGEMSIIGPRPMLPELLKEVPQRHLGRFTVPPGLTGLAQVRGRNTLPWAERFRLDDEYVHSLGLWQDLLILFATVRVVLTGDGIVMDRNPDQVRTPPPAERAPK